MKGRRRTKASLSVPGADARPPAPRPVGSSRTTARHGCGRRRRPPSCRGRGGGGELGTHSEPGPWGWATYPGKFPLGCAIGPRGQPRCRRRRPETGATGLATQTPLPAPPGKMETLRAPLEPGPCGRTGPGRTRVLSAVPHRPPPSGASLVMDHCPPNRRGEQPTGCEPLFCSPSTPTSRAHARRVRFQDSAEGGAGPPVPP